MFDIALWINRKSDGLFIEKLKCSSLVVNNDEVIIYEMDGIHCFSRDTVSMIDFKLRGIKSEEDKDSL